jgi:hypothetical protein
MPLGMVDFELGTGRVPGFCELAWFAERMVARMNLGLEEPMDEETCFEWGNLFASPWDDLVNGMEARAREMGLTQDLDGKDLIWRDGGEDRVKYCFVSDPSRIEDVRRIFNDESNAALAVCFIVVRQPDASETRGDIVFDIFRMSPESYLWHFYRVYTPPR